MAQAILQVHKFSFFFPEYSQLLSLVRTAKIAVLTSFVVSKGTQALIYSSIFTATAAILSSAFRGFFSSDR